MPLEAVQAQAGHACIESTRIYLHLGDDWLASQYRKAFEVIDAQVFAIGPPGDLLAWMQTLALHDHPARQWEPKRLRHRLLTIPATLARTGRRVQLHLKDTAPFADLTCTGWTRLAALAPP